MNNKKWLIIFISTIILFIILLILNAAGILKPLRFSKDSVEGETNYGGINVEKDDAFEFTEEEIKESLRQEEFGENDITPEEAAYLEENKVIGILDEDRVFLDFIGLGRQHGIARELYLVLKETEYTDCTLYKVDYDSIKTKGNTTMALDLICTDNEDLKLRIQYNKVSNELQVALYSEKYGYLYPDQNQERPYIPIGEVWDMLTSDLDGTEASDTETEESVDSEETGATDDVVIITE